jgi:hypothetical protein
MGVCRRSDNGKYRSFIQDGGKRVWLGCFDTLEDGVPSERKRKNASDIMKTTVDKTKYH